MTAVGTKGGRWCKFRGANREMQESATRVYHAALRSGEIARQPCAICGAERSEGHHEDYAEPTNVTWLCRWHHSQRHQGYTFDEMLAWEDAA